MVRPSRICVIPDIHVFGLRQVQVSRASSDVPRPLIVPAQDSSDESDVEARLQGNLQHFAGSVLYIAYVDCVSSGFWRNRRASA